LKACERRSSAEFQKLVSDEVSPLMPEELAKVTRDPEIVEMLKKFSGVDPAALALRQSDWNKARPRATHAAG
jgi:hypothetical protein